MQRLTDRDLEASTQDYLQKNFAPLLESNPRAMKRFVNAYAVYRDIAILSHTDFEAGAGRDKLVLWTIMSLRWPQLEECLVANPELADGLAGYAELPKVEGKLQLLLALPEVRCIFDGSVAGTKLDTDAVLSLRQLSTNISSGKARKSIVSDASHARLRT